jgi:hypothetical protein
MSTTLAGRRSTLTELLPPLESQRAEINTPRDRQGRCEPRIVRKRQRRFEGFDDKILALYSRDSESANECYERMIWNGARGGMHLIPVPLGPA